MPDHSPARLLGRSFDIDVNSFGISQMQRKSAGLSTETGLTVSGWRREVSVNAPNFWCRELLRETS